jgi:hypothetical protein
MSDVAMLRWLSVTDFGQAMPTSLLSFDKSLADSRHTQGKKQGCLQMKHQTQH